VLPALVRTARQLLARTAAGDVATARHLGHVLPAPVTAASSLFGFRFSRRLIDDGYAAARSFLEIRAAHCATVRAFPARRIVARRQAA
jgi:hypothetical protein